MNTKDKYLITKYIKMNMGITYIFISKRYGISISNIRKYLSGEYRSAHIEDIFVNRIGIPKPIIEGHFKKLGKKNLEIKTQLKKKASSYAPHIKEIEKLIELGISLRSIWKIIGNKIEEENRITYSGFYRWLQRTKKYKIKKIALSVEGVIE